MARVQDLRRYHMPPDFRGRPAWFVQLWHLVQATLFAFSPRIAYGWRRWLLRVFGARIGRGVLVRASVRVIYPWKLAIGDWSWIGEDVELYALDRIEIGSDVVVSQRSYLCAGGHDHRRPDFPTFGAPIVIEDEAWVATDVYVAPGVRIGRGAVVGARSTVLTDLPPLMICHGSPARAVRPRDAEDAGRERIEGGGAI